MCLCNPDRGLFNIDSFRGVGSIVFGDDKNRNINFLFEQNPSRKSMATKSHGKGEILTPDEVAKLLRVSRRTINHLVAAKAIPFVRIGKRTIRFKRDAVMKWFREPRNTVKGK
jgi:excisionase family DNA binding protein